MKAVMLSIKPKWCELIASGKKTVEVRRTKPKIETPFKCYIYETKDKHFENIGVHYADGSKDFINHIGKVIGEFVCDRITEYECSSDGFGELATTCGTCLTYDEILNYCSGNDLYGWHISDLVIYDKPKELSEFYVWKKCNSCRESGYESTACCYDEDCKVPAVITRPPQSWCYCEELKGEGKYESRYF